MPKQHYRPDSFHLLDCVCYLQKRGQRLMQERIEMRFAEQVCTFQQWIALMQIRVRPSTTIADLCRDLHYDSGAMTRLIDQLESRDLVNRRRNVKDRRAIEMSLTEAGERLLDKLTSIACDTLNSILEDFSHNDVKQLRSLLKRMIARSAAAAEVSLAE